MHHHVRRSKDLYPWIPQENNPTQTSTTNSTKRKQGNPHLETFVVKINAATTENDKISILQKYYCKSGAGGCSVHPGAANHAFPHCNIVRCKSEVQGLRDEFARLSTSATPPPSTRKIILTEFQLKNTRNT
eukprot:13750200-Ditylum_brightwellii.AAC.1